MNPPSQETTNKLTYTIPGLLELENSLFNNQPTGSMSFNQNQYYWREISLRNTTGPIQKGIDVALLYFYQPLNTWQFEELSEYWNSHNWEFISSETQKLLRTIYNKKIIDGINEILSSIKTNLIYFDTGSLSPIGAFLLENGSVALEWIIGHFRMGFTFDIISEQSGYYLVSDNSAGDIRNYGFFNGLNKNNIIKSMLVLIFGK